MWPTLVKLFEAPELLSPISRLGAAAVIIALIALALHGVTRVVARRLRAWDHDEDEIGALDVAAETLEATSVGFELAMGVRAAMPLFVLGEDAAGVLEGGVAVILFLQIGRWLQAAMLAMLERARQQRAEDPARLTALGAIGFVGRVIIWAAVALLILDNLGIEITALLASLGVGGVAVALAVQNILGDLFASFSIVLDKPFEVGDFIIVGDMMGTVEHIGIKTTRLRSLGGEQLVFSNGDLLKSRVRNYKRMDERRVVLELGLPLDTSMERLRQMPAWMRQAVEAQELTRMDRAHLAKIGEHSVRFELVYYVLDPNYNTHMDIQQAILLDVLEQLRAHDLELAYPTHKLFLKSDDPDLQQAIVEMAQARAS